MTIYVPVGAIAIFIVLFYFYSINKKNRIKAEERRERLSAKQDELLEVLRRKAAKEHNPENDDTKNEQE